MFQKCNSLFKCGPAYFFFFYFRLLVQKHDIMKITIVFYYVISLRSKPFLLVAS